MPPRPHPNCSRPPPHQTPTDHSEICTAALRGGGVPRLAGTGTAMVKTGVHPPNGTGRRPSHRSRHDTMTQSPCGHDQSLILRSARRQRSAPSTTPPSSEHIHDPSPPTESTMATQSMMLRLHATPLQRITRPSPTRTPVALMSSPTVLKSCGCNRTRPATPCTAHLALRAFPTDVQLQLPVPTTGTHPDVPTLHDDAPHPPVPIDLENITCNA